MLNLRVAPETELDPFGLNTEQKLKVLLLEYDSLRRESQMYSQQVVPKFALLAVVVSGTLAFASKNADYGVLFVLIPPLAIVIGFLGIAQGYAMMVVSARISDIEEEIDRLNGGKRLMTFERDYVPRFVTGPTIRLQRASGTFWHLPNPMHILNVMTLLIGISYMSWSTFEGYLWLSGKWRTAYLTAMIIAGLILIIIAACSFFIWKFGLRRQSISERGNYHTVQAGSVLTIAKKPLHSIDISFPAQQSRSQVRSA